MSTTVTRLEQAVNQLIGPGRAKAVDVASVVIPLAFGVMANVCYTGGWMAELWIRRWLGREMEPAGPALFRYGFAFSIGLTLFPLAMASLAKLSLILRFLFAA